MPTPLQSPLSPVWAPCRQQNDVGKCGGDFLGGAVVASTAGGMSLIPGRGRSCVLSSVAKKKKKKKRCLGHLREIKIEIFFLSVGGSDFESQLIIYQL